MIQVKVIHEMHIMREALVALLRAEQMFVAPSLADGRHDLAGGRDARRAGGESPAPVWVADENCLDSLPALPAAPCTSAGADLPGIARPALLVLVGPRRPGRLRRALEAGALGYVDKYGAPKRLVAGIRAVASGERFIDESLAFDFVQATRMPLTPRELNVLSLAAEGAPIRDIAGVLHLACGTVRNYLASAIRKVGARNRLDAVRISRLAGWL